MHRSKSPKPGTERSSLTSLQWQMGSLPLAPPGKPFNKIKNKKELG